ncbi:unnamed protein product, partial [Fusarium graminearum]
FTPRMCATMMMHHSIITRRHESQPWTTIPVRCLFGIKGAYGSPSRATVESHMMRSIGFHVLFQKHALKTLLMVHRLDILFWGN